MAIFSLNELRAAAPAELQGLSDDALLRDYSQRVGKSFEETADYFGFKPRGTLSEMGRQAVGGAVVDLPKMVGQGLQYTGVAPQMGKELVEGAEERAVDYVPDMRGRGLVGQAGVLGARGLAPVGAVMATSMLPGGQAIAPVAAATLFGTSSAQETYEKLKAEGASEQDAIDAARRVGLVQGPLEGVATAVGLRAARPLAAALGGKTTGAVAGALTDTGIAKPFLKGMAANAVVQPATEVAQDVGTSLIERAYGAKDEDLGEIAKQSALGGFGLTMLLGPLALGGSMSRARGAQALKDALYNPDTPTEVRARAMDAVMAEAKRQGVGDADVDNWFNEQLTLEDARIAAQQKVDAEQKSVGIDLTSKPDDYIKRINETMLADFNPEAEIAKRAAAGRPMSEAEASSLLSSFAAAQKAGQEFQDLMVSKDETLKRVQGIGQQYQDLVGQQGDQMLRAQEVGDQARGITSRLESEAAQQEAPIISLLNAAAGAQELPGMVKGIGTKADFKRITNPDVMQPVETSDVQPPVQRTQLLPQQPAPFSNIRLDRPTAVEPTVPAVPLTARPTQTQGAEGGTQTAQAVQAKAQGQELSPAESKQLSKLLADAEGEDIGDVLPASVKSGAKAVPGRTRIDQSGLKRIRDALVLGKEVADEKTGQIVDALRNFANAYKVYSDQGGQALSRRDAIPESKTATQFTDEQVGAIEMQAANVQQALAELGDAVGGNAKDVEAVVRLVKDMVQKKIVSPGSMKSDVRKELGKLDTMLSQAWAAAKREAFMGKQPDTADIRTGAIRGSIEVKGKGKMPRLVKVAKEGIYAGKDLGTLKGLPGILHYMRTNGTPMERALSLALRESLTLSESKINVKFMKEGKPRFDPADNTVYLNEEESPEVILHEAFHAALQSFVYKNPNHPAVVQLKKSLKSVVTYKGELTGRALEVQNLLKDLMAKGNELDAVLELVSYGNTLAEFRKALQGMKSDKNIPKTFLESATKAWAAIKQIASRLLGGKASLASDVLQSSLELLDKARSQTAVAGQGQVLEAAITTTKPVSDAKIAESLGVSEQDYSRWDKSNAAQLQLTQRAFEAVGWSEANAKKLVGTAGDKTRAFISKNFPGAEIVLGWINSRYNVNETVSRIMDTFKLNKGIGYQYAEDLANVISRRPAEDVNALIAYMDGDKKALDKLPDSMKLKAVADKLDSWFKMYVAELTPVEQRYFQSRKFSETLLFPERTEQVAGQTFGLGKINEVLGLKREGETELDQNWFQKDDNGDLVVDGDAYRVFEVNRLSTKGGMMPAGFMSAARFAELGGVNPMGFTVDTSRKWLFEGMKDNKYSFVTNTTAKDKIANEKADDVANALRNTIAALANNYASKNFIKSVYGMGRGDNAHAQVAFDSLEDVNAMLNEGITDPKDKVVILDNMVLKASHEISRSPQTKALYRQSGTWVELPDSPVYGDLAGKFIPGPVWNAMGDMSDRQPIVNWRAANNTMRWFKKSKTVWNFGTHVTNTASNVTMAMVHDISFGAMLDAAKILAKYEANPKSLTKPELELMMAFRDSGAMLADYSSAEVKEALYKAHEANLRGGEDISVMRRVGGWLGVEKAKADWLQAQAKKVGKGAEYLDDLSSQLYAAEDNIFRMAAFLKTAGALQQRAGVRTPSAEMMREAGLFARKAFGDYDIDSKAVKIARQTAMPFISWFYAMAPVIGRIAVYEPWKLANVMMAYMILEAAMGGAAGGDDEELRKQGPESIRERMLGSVGPYMNIRIPFMGDEENPVYYKLGDYFPLASFTRGLPNGMMGQSWIPAALTPSGPFVSGILGLVGGVDPYTGKSLHKPTDTELQKLWTSTKFAYDTATIPLINSRNISKVDDLVEGKTGITGNEPSALPIARAFGMKFYDFNVTEQAAINDIVVKRIQKDFKSAMTKAKRDEYRKAYPDYDELDATLEELRTRMDKEVTKARGGAEE
jgi:hypothetical protein